MRLTRPRGSMPPHPAFAPTPGVPPQTPAAALQRGIPVSGGTPAAAASIQPHGDGLAVRPPGLQAGDRGAEPLDELTLRALWGDR